MGLSKRSAINGSPVNLHYLGSPFRYSVPPRTRGPAARKGQRWRKHRGPHLQMKIIDDIEVLRAIAISMVLMAHSSILLGWPWKGFEAVSSYLYLGTGVDLFFAISGFVIAKSLIGESAIKFWIRRAYRILPAAWLWLAIGLVATAYMNQHGTFGSMADNFKDAIASFLHVQNIHYGICINETGRACARGGIPFGIYWSLSLEEQFYFVLPLLFLLPRRVMCAGLIVAVAIQLFTIRSAMGAQLRTDALMIGVLLGVWSAHPSYQRFKPTWLRNKLIGAPTIAIMVAALCVVHATTARPFAAAALISAVLVFLASHGSGYITVPMRPLFLWIGSRSYALYLAHMIAFGIARELALSWSMPTAVLLLLAGMLLVSFSEITHRLIERPLRDRGRSFAERFANQPLPQRIKTFGV